MPFSPAGKLATLWSACLQFTLTPRANVELDRDNLVIGQLLDEESMSLLARLNSLAVNNYDSAPLAKVQITRVRVL